MAIYKGSRGAELRSTMKQLQLVGKLDLNLQPLDLKSGTLTSDLARLRPCSIMQLQYYATVLNLVM